MSKPNLQSWQAIQTEVTRRISARIWPPGELLPNEVDLAEEFGCARATVNRALRELAGKGILERRRKAGTRVALNPVRRAVLSIPIIREEIEQSGGNYGYRLVDAIEETAPEKVCNALKLSAGSHAYHVISIHLSDAHPYVFEDRWVNLKSVPDITKAELQNISANEWLIQNAPFSNGSLVFSATTADTELAKYLACDIGAALFCLERSTWDGTNSITFAQLYYRPGYRLNSTI